VLIFSLPLVVVEFLAILCFFPKYKLQNISENNAATWWQKLAHVACTIKNILTIVSDDHK
jgi:hypothetical protein